MKASTILLFLFFTPIFNNQNQFPMEQHKIEQLEALDLKYQELDALYAQYQELIDEHIKPELLQQYKKLALFIDKEQDKLLQLEEGHTHEGLNEENEYTSKTKITEDRRSELKAKLQSLKERLNALSI